MSKLVELSPRVTEKDKKQEFRILAIDNNPDMLETMGHIAHLAASRVRFAGVEKYQAGLDMIPLFNPHLILTDYNHPAEAVNGLTFAQAIHARFPGTPIALVTAGVEESLETLAERGERFVHFVLHKDQFTMPTVLELIEKVERRNDELKRQR